MWKVVSKCSAGLVFISHTITARTPPQQHRAYNPWDAQETRYQNPSFNPESYNATGVLATASYAATQPSRQPEHSYGASSVPQPSDPYYASHYQSPTNMSSSPPPTNTSAYAAPSSNAVRGPRGPTSVVMAPPGETYGDSPPTYDAGPSRGPGQWGSKG